VWSIRDCKALRNETRTIVFVTRAGRSLTGSEGPSPSDRHKRTRIPLLGALPQLPQVSHRNRTLRRSFPDIRVQRVAASAFGMSGTCFGTRGFRRWRGTRVCATEPSPFSDVEILGRCLGDCAAQTIKSSTSSASALPTSNYGPPGKPNGSPFSRRLPAYLHGGHTVQRPWWTMGRVADEEPGN